MPGLMEAVPLLLQQAAQDIVLPMFHGHGARPEEKSPGEWVTAADRGAETFLTPRLAALLPGSSVVGEEYANSHPRVLDRLAGAGDVWVLDPLDGTANFVAGTGPIALMAALVRNGQTVAAWILDPLGNRLAAAERGAGAWLDGARVRLGGQLPPPTLRGAVPRRFLPAHLTARVEAVLPAFAELTPGSRCAGHDYPSIITGELDFALFWRTLPWDHLPGTLLVTEAGGLAGRLDGSRYRAADQARPGLLVATSAAVWARVRDAVLPDRGP